MPTNAEILQASRRVRKAADEKRSAERERNDLIRVAYDEGLSVRQLSQVAALSISHIEKILGAEMGTPADP